MTNVKPKSLNQSFKPTALLFVSIMLLGCGTNVQPLPQDGPTTSEIWHGVSSGSQREVTHNSSYRDDGAEATGSDGISLSPPMTTTMSTQTTAQLRQLNRHFKRVPNPEIIGYVAPHFNGAGMPVPGYFTLFKLYKKDGYALRSEDAATGVSR